MDNTKIRMASGIVNQAIFGERWYRKRTRVIMGIVKIISDPSENNQITTGLFFVLI